MLKINKVENNEVTELLKKYEKKEKNISLVLRIIFFIILGIGLIYFMPSLLGMLSNLFSIEFLFLLIFGIILFLILGNFILDMLLRILNIFR